LAKFGKEINHDAFAMDWYKALFDQIRDEDEDEVELYEKVYNTTLSNLYIDFTQFLFYRGNSNSMKVLRSIFLYIFNI